MSKILRFTPWILTVVLAAIVAIMWATIEHRNAELSALQGKYNQLVTEANQKLSDATKRYNDLVADANQKIGAANRPEVEVQVGFRKAIVNSGNVAVLKNLAGKAIAITVDVERSSSGKSKTYDLTLDPGQMKEIGEVEGWAFVSGDKLRISQPDHKSLTFASP